MALQAMHVSGACVTSGTSLEELPKPAMASISSTNGLLTICSRQSCEKPKTSYHCKSFEAVQWQNCGENLLERD